MSKRIRLKADPCTRPIDEQCADRSGAARRGDHPALARIELLSDAELDALRARFPSRAEDGMDEYDALTEELARRDAELSARLAEVADRLPFRPVASIAVCTACGARGYLTAERPWDVDRAMARLHASERDVLAVRAQLAAEPERALDLDAFSTDELRELLSSTGGARRLPP